MRRSLRSTRAEVSYSEEPLPVLDYTDVSSEESESESDENYNATPLDRSVRHYSCHVHTLHNTLEFAKITYIHIKFLRSNDNTEYRETGFNRLRGEDSWIGRVVKANFGELGDYMGVVTECDEDAKFPGCRVFHVEFEDGDEAWLGVDEVASILLAPDFKSAAPAPAELPEPVCMCVIFILSIFCFTDTCNVCTLTSNANATENANSQAEKQEEKTGQI